METPPLPGLVSDAKPTATYYAVFDDKNVPKGFWNNDIYPDKEDGSRNDKIPLDAVEISYETWLALLDNQPRSRYIGGRVVVVDPEPPPPPEPNPLEVRIEALEKALLNR